MKLRGYILYCTVRLKKSRLVQSDNVHISQLEQLPREMMQSRPKTIYQLFL